jgi:hypothetical protein
VTLGAWLEERLICFQGSSVAILFSSVEPNDFPSESQGSKARYENLHNLWILIYTCVLLIRSLITYFLTIFMCSARGGAERYTKRNKFGRTGMPMLTFQLSSDANKMYIFLSSSTFHFPSLFRYSKRKKIIIIIQDKIRACCLGLLFCFSLRFISLFIQNSIFNWINSNV